MGERGSLNPYREPQGLDSELERGPGLVRLVGYRLGAVVLGLLGLVVLLVVVLTLAYLGLRGVSGGLLVTGALGGAMLLGARALWYRAALSADESRALDALHDRELLAELAATQDWSGVEPLDPGDYAGRSDRELWEIARRIDPEVAGERHRQLVSAIRARLGAEGALPNAREGAGEALVRDPP